MTGLSDGSAEQNVASGKEDELTSNLSMKRPLFVLASGYGPLNLKPEERSTAKKESTLSQRPVSMIVMEIVFGLCG